MADNIRILPGVAAPTEQNLDGALAILEFLTEEVKAGRVVSALITTLAPNDQDNYYIINVGHTKKMTFYGLATCLLDWLREQ